MLEVKQQGNEPNVEEVIAQADSSGRKASH
jgi:hypothetical protein